MAKRRITICMIVPFVIIVTVVGLFFTVTDPTSWPEQTIELSSTDMRLAPSISTIWCESIAMTSAGDFVAYRIQYRPKIDHNSLTKQVTNLKLKIDNRGRLVSVHELRYFLLQGTMISIFPCSIREKAQVHIWKHNFSKKCFLSEKNADFSDYDDDDSDEDSSDESKRITENVKKKQGSCSKPLTSRDIPITHANDHAIECENTGAALLTLNVTSEDTYIIVVTNENRQSPNSIRLQVRLDRTFYDYHKIQKSTSICGGAPSSTSTCTVPLTFASGERVLLWVPPMRTSSTKQKHVAVSVQCRPRIALFALLTVLFPVLLFVIVSFVLKNDRKRSREQCGSLDSEVGITRNDRRESFVSPLLPESRNSISAPTSDATRANLTCANDDAQPPPYEVLFDLPPPYSSLKISPEDKP